MRYLKKIFEFMSVETKTFEKITKNEYNMSVYGEPNIGSDLHKRDYDVIEIQKEFIENNWKDFSKNEINLLKKSGFKCKVVSMAEQDWFDVEKHFLLINYVYIFKLPDEWYYLTNAGYGYYKCDQLEGVIDCLKKFKL